MDAERLSLFGSPPHATMPLPPVAVQPQWQPTNPTRKPARAPCMHIEFFQQKGQTNSTVRATPWGRTPSYGHVIDATTATLWMVGGGMETLTLSKATPDASDCTKLSVAGASFLTAVFQSLAGSRSQLPSPQLWHPTGRPIGISQRARLPNHPETIISCPGTHGV